MMNNRPALDLSTPIGQIARHYPAAIPLLEAFDVEYACKGGRPLRDAALAAGVAAEELLDAVNVAAADSPPSNGSLAELIETIVTDHHRFDEKLLQDVLVRASASAAPEAARIHRLVVAVRSVALAHILREERELFPRIEELELHPHRVRAGSISRPLLVEFVEHDTIHEWLVKARELGLRLRPADPSLAEAVEALDKGVHRHLHMENNVLIPRVIDLENRMKAYRESATMH